MNSMTDRLFVDTNVLVYSVDPRERDKRNLAAELIRAGLARGLLVTSPQTLGECYRALTRRSGLVPQREAREFVWSLTPTCTAPFDLENLPLAWNIETRTGYSWWDCMMLASALRADCTRFVTEDMEDGRMIDRITIVNPFRNPSSAVLPS
jgi:predicted nucleic acid-binding protein